MAVAESASDSVFLVGLGLFSVFIIIFMVSLFWKLARAADDFITRHW